MRIILIRNSVYHNDRHNYIPCFGYPMSTSRGRGKDLIKRENPQSGGNDPPRCWLHECGLLGETIEGEALCNILYLKKIIQYYEI